MSRIKYSYSSILIKCLVIIFLTTASTAKVRAQTVSAPDLNCVAILINSSGDILLTWVPATNICGTFLSYYIYRSTNLTGPYTLVDTVAFQFQTVYQDNVGNGNSVTYYYYMLTHVENCPGAIVMHSDTIDNLVPEPPVINYVTVTDGFAELHWEPGESPETFGYIIYRVTPSGKIPIDTVYGKNTVSYTDFTSSVSNDSMSYTIASIDSCFNTGIINIAPQHTIYLTKSLNACAQMLTLNWYKYDHWQQGVEKYDILVSTNGGVPVLVQTLAPSVLTYNLTGLIDGDSVCVTIVAKETNSAFTSSSNSACAKMNVVAPASDFYIRNITVPGTNLVEVYYSMNALADLTNLKIERSLDSIFFSPLATINIPGDLSVVNMFADTTALTNELSYYYRLIATDSCSGSDTSTSGKSILLTGYSFSDLTFLLNWNQADFKYGTVYGYELYREDDGVFGSVTVLDPDQTQYQESGISISTPCYYIEAIDSMVFPSGISETVRSRSNVLCLNLPSQIYMPNAFAPQGKNNIFKPILNFPVNKTYSFSIFNRWGEEIFSTKDPDHGWDGTFRGTLVAQGAYVYQVMVMDDHNKMIEAKGTVLVVR